MHTALCRKRKQHSCGVAVAYADGSGLVVHEFENRVWLVGRYYQAVLCQDNMTAFVRLYTEYVTTPHEHAYCRIGDTYVDEEVADRALAS